MAVLTNDELADLRQRLASDVSEIGWTKAEVNMALQAIEDWFEDQRTALSGLIDAATTYNFTGPQKKKMVRWFLQQKFGREVS